MELRTSEIESLEEAEEFAHEMCDEMQAHIVEGESLFVKKVVISDQD